MGRTDPQLRIPGPIAKNARILNRIIEPTIQVNGHHIYGPDGQPTAETNTTAGAFERLQSLEVEQATGDVYVLDLARKKVVDKFNASGIALPFSATGKSSLNISPSEGSMSDGGIAIDNSPVNPGRIYVARDQPGSLLAFDPTGSLLWELQPGSSTFDPLCAAAVDAEGHLWVSERFGPTGPQVREYDSSGSPPAQLYSFPYTNGGSFPCSLDFDAAGNVYIAVGDSGKGVYKYVGGVYSSTLDPQESNGVAVNRSSTLPSPSLAGHIFTSHLEGFNEYDSGGAPVGSFGKGVLSGGKGIAYNHALDRVYVANFSGPKVYAFGPAVTGTVPDVTSEAATEEEVSKAKLHGKINPQSVPNSWFFEWKPGGDVYHNWGEAQSSAPQSISPTDSLEHSVSFNANHLDGNTTYQARLVGVNTSNGLRAVSSPVTFTTKKAAAAPVLTIATPVALSGTTEEVKATVNPWEDFGTTWWLETSRDPACLSGFSSRSVHNLESEANSPVGVSEEITAFCRANTTACGSSPRIASAPPSPKPRDPRPRRYRRQGRSRRLRRRAQIRRRA